MTDIAERAIESGTEEDAARARIRTVAGSEVVVLYALSLGAALALSGVLVTATGGSSRTVFDALLDGSLTAPGRWGLTLGTAVPLLLVALGTIVSSKAGLVNIGQEGQLLIGSAVAAFVATELGGAHGPHVLVLSMIAGVVGGAAWASIAGVLKFWRRVPEVLSTLLLVNIAGSAFSYALKRDGWLLAPAEGRGNRNQISRELAPDTRIGRVTWFDNEFPVSVFLAIALAAAVGVLLVRSVPGFRLRMLGRSPRAAQRAGVSATGYGMAALMVSGGFAGLAGWAMLAGGDFGGPYALVPGFSVSIGWTGLLVALVARERPLASIAVAFVFAALRTGSQFVAATGVERRITDVVQALLTLALLVPPALLYVRERHRALNAMRART
jgi:simple sugar transport system permease protein